MRCGPATEPGERIAAAGSRAGGSHWASCSPGQPCSPRLDQIHLHTADVIAEAHRLRAVLCRTHGRSRAWPASSETISAGRRSAWRSGGCPSCSAWCRPIDIFNSWADSRPLVAELSRFLQPGAHYLVEAAEVPTYYLRGNPDAKATQFALTYYISYTGQNGITMHGNAGFEAAVRQGYFHVIAYDDTATVPLDNILARMLKADSSYRLAAPSPTPTASAPTTSGSSARRAHLTPAPGAALSQAGSPRSRR